jgi:hypothetical protein
MDYDLVADWNDLETIQIRSNKEQSWGKGGLREVSQTGAPPLSSSHLQEKAFLIIICEHVWLK